MRCLGIPNTAHFANVTQIEDALSRKLIIFHVNIFENGIETVESKYSQGYVMQKKT